MTRLQVGERIAGFVVEATRTVPELQLSAWRLRHPRTGAQHVHVARDDPNSVFSIAFKTAPMDSTGVPHILEHTTLCGSRTYPVRDPFFKMLNRSMATYMNAWTAADFTMYPFATQNAADMRNLRGIYVDACFRPLLTKGDFQQEGWRLEHSVLKDSGSPIAFKGVVYNEMKGALSDANSLYVTRLQSQLFPGTTYSHVSGGDPKHITDLTYEQLVEFHRVHYHPTNAKFYTYGTFPLEEHLSFVDESLREFEKLSQPPRAELKAKRFSKPVTLETFGPPDPLGDPMKQTKLSVSYLLNDVADTFETFALRVLSYLLIDGQASPFYKSLIESNIGSDYVASTGYDTSTKDASFSIGLQGMRKEDMGEVTSRIQRVFEEVATAGFDSQRIEAAIHQTELGIKHKTANFGLGISHGIMSSWMHGADPLEWLEVNAKIARLRTELANGPYFQNLISKYFLSNPHRLTFAMHAIDKFNADLAAEEEQRLKRIVDGLTESEKQAVHRDGLALAQLQNKKQDINAILPTLSLADVERKARIVELDHDTVGTNRVPVQWRRTATNEITYFRAILNLPDLPAALRPYMSLYTTALTSLGTKTMSSAEFDEAIRLRTGGIGASTFLATHRQDLDGYQEGITLSGNCLDRNVDHMFGLLDKMMTDVDFSAVDRERVRTIVLNAEAGMKSSLTSPGFVRRVASSPLTIAKSIGDVYGGLTQLEFLSKLVADGSVEPVVEAFKKIHAFIHAKATARIALTNGADATISDRNANAVASFLGALGITAAPAVDLVQRFASDGFQAKFGQKLWLPMPFASNFAAASFRVHEYTHPDAMVMQVLASLMTHHFLHREIREKNGAYGGGATYSALDGVLSFYSYRDPSPVQSVASFRAATAWAAHEPFTEQQLTEAKLSIFSSLDAPLNVSAEGMSHFEHGITSALRQQRRDTLFAVGVQDVHRAAAWLESEFGADRASIAVLASADQEHGKGATDGWSVRELAAAS